MCIRDSIKALLGLIHPDSGDMQILGMDAAQNEKDIKKELGVVFADQNFPDDLRPPEITKIMGNIYKTWDKALFEDFLSRFRLPADKRLKDLSKGMKMKLSIAAALSHRPRLLILDEATSGLDPVVRNEILDIFQEFIEDENHAILMSSHITSDLERVADYITLSLIHIFYKFQSASQLHTMFMAPACIIVLTSLGFETSPLVITG